MHFSVTRPWSREGKKGHQPFLAETSLITLVHLLSQSRFSQTLCGDVEASGKDEVLKTKSMVIVSLYIKTPHRKL